MVTSRELGEQFSLRESNPDYGGGILYALRYSPEMLDAKKSQVLDTLCDWGLEFVEVDDTRIGIQPVDDTFSSEHLDRLGVMAEELSVISDAQAYQDMGWGLEQNTISELVSAIQSQAMHTMGELRTIKTEAKIELYDTATMFIPQVLRELRYADAQSELLTNAERRQLDELQRTGEFVGRAVGGRTILMGI